MSDEKQIIVESPTSISTSNSVVEYVAKLEASLDLFQERIAELEFAQEDIGWTQIGGSAEYEFSRDHLRKMIARSRLYFLQNPLIRRAVSLQADYVFAQGLNIQGTNQIVNGIIQDFLDDPGNMKELFAHQAKLLKEQTLQLDGNVFFVLFTDKLNTGKVNLRSILVDEIIDIVTNPDDANEVWFYKRRWTPTNEDGLVSEPLEAYYPDIDYIPKNVTTLTGTRNSRPIYWDAPILHVKTGSLIKSKFGAPETYSALEWAKAHSKMLADWATIISMYARFAFKLTTPGNKNSIVAARQRLETTTARGVLGESNPASTVGSTFIRQKDGVDIEPVKTSGATTSARDARELRIMVAAAMGLPDPMLSGEVDVGNLATAKTLDRPTELRFRSRQKLWEDVIQKIIVWVLKWAIEARNGQLKQYFKYDAVTRRYVGKMDTKTNKSMDLHVEVVFPPILERTVQERIDAVIGAVTLSGKTFVIDSPELKKLTIRLMLQALGISDVDEVVEMIFLNLPDDVLTPNTQKDQKQDDPATDSGIQGFKASSVR